ncbi:hypothetical protein ACOI1C_02075 [Bacillus sp. DJP31]|uniref:hypothetical protein n=1 Tax=Bacillus sp. DJP31 TaxID=3409789 RepID=UPI003BB6F3A5
MKFVISLACLLAVTACGTDDPKPPEASVMPMYLTYPIDESIVASASINENNVTVRHHVKGNDVYVEVIVPSFTFTSSNKKINVDGEGYLKLFLNGKQVDEIHQAAFIVKGLPTGKHNLKVELVHNDATSYGIAQEMSVIIP